MSLIADALKRAQKIQILKAKEKVEEGIFLPKLKGPSKKAFLGKFLRKRIFILLIIIIPFLSLILYSIYILPGRITQGSMKVIPVPTKVTPESRSMKTEQEQTAVVAKAAEAPASEQKIPFPKGESGEKKEEIMKEKMGKKLLQEKKELAQREKGIRPPIEEEQKLEETLYEAKLSPSIDFPAEEEFGSIPELVPEPSPLGNELGEPLPPQRIRVEKPPPKKVVSAKELVENFNLGVTSHKNKDMVAAIEAYKKVIQLDPKNLEAINNLGVVYKDMGRADEAIEQYQKALSINPNFAKAHNNLGVAYFMKGEYIKAIREYQKAISFSPDNLESYTNLGVLYKKQAKMDKALQAFEKALSINPFHAETHYNLALIYDERKNIEKASYHYQKFLELAPESYSILKGRVRERLDLLSPNWRKQTALKD